MTNTTPKYHVTADSFRWIGSQPMVAAAGAERAHAALRQLYAMPECWCGCEEPAA